MKLQVWAVCAALSIDVVALVAIPDTLPPSSWADTEASTNIPFTARPAGAQLRDFQVGMSFLATPSNNVQVAFGDDTDGDGALSAAETDLLLGWDSGKWMLGGEARCTAATTNDVKDLSWTLRMRNGAPYWLEVAECGTLLVAVTNVPVLAKLHDPAWNLMRVTVRGVDSAAEHLAVTARPWGCVLRLR